MNQPDQKRGLESFIGGYGLLTGMIIAAGVGMMLAFSAGANVDAPSIGQLDTEHYQKEPASRRQQATEHVIMAEPGAVGEERPIDDVSGQRVEAGENQNYAQQNLEVQQNLALSGWAMVVIAFFSLLVTFWALLFLRKTYAATAAMVTETEELTEESIKATKAMVKQNELTEVSQRPWLKVSFDPERRRKITLDRDNGLWTVYQPILLRNWGQSPAKNVTLFGQCWLEGPMPIELPKIIPKDASYTSYSFAPSIVFPSEVINLPLNIGSTLTREEADSQNFVFAITAIYDSQGVEQSTTLIGKVEPFSRTLDRVEEQGARLMHAELRAT